MIHGYKCFNKGLIDNYGNSYQVNKIYQCEGDIVFGKNGFHFCSRLEDTLRYFDTFKEEVSICEVNGFGKCDVRNDEYNGYFDMYACEKMHIVRELEREEIIAYGLELLDMQLMRFISSFKLDEIEKEMFRKKFTNNLLINEYIDYYQDNVKDAFARIKKK